MNQANGCNGSDSCCTKDNQCSEGDGDCDVDDDCKDDLKCGLNNCQKKSGSQWDDSDDCCFMPKG